MIHAYSVEDKYLHSSADESAYPLIRDMTWKNGGKAGWLYTTIHKQATNSNLNLIGDTQIHLTIKCKFLNYNWAKPSYPKLAITWS